MSEREAFIHAIRAHDASDVPRLVYADWLDEHGEPDRAEFIRLQCWLAANPNTHPEWAATRQREQLLVLEHGPRWEAELAGYSYLVREFDRGFCSWFYWYNLKEFCWVLPELMRVTPTHRLALSSLNDDDLRELPTCPELKWIRAIVTNADTRGLTLVGIRELCEIAEFQNLESLNLRGAYLVAGNPDAGHLAHQDVLPNLTTLALGLSFEPNIANIIALIRSPFRQQLKGLSVSYLSEQEIFELCDVPELARLTRLNIGWTISTDAAAHRLAECPYLEGIELLNYSGEDHDNLSLSAQSHLRDRFGDRVVLDPESHGQDDVFSQIYPRPDRTWRTIHHFTQ
jgi:uncharacterized protein (TIGR02996 family)